jgi:uncharacterized membrane protein YidH (DUF202 family)
MEVCAFHPEHAAVESCEVCNKPLCGLCLWYTAEGHRLCEVHARARQNAGEQVLPPHTYREAIPNSLWQAPEAAAESGRRVYRGNETDLGALLAAVAALTTVFSCMGGAYCLPLFIVLLGAATYINADQALDPKRTRLLAGLGVGAVALMLLVTFAFFAFYLLIVFVAIFAGGGP